jgi:dipicolinate synthase subunit A
MWGKGFERMLTDKHFIFIGGDARQLEVIKSFIKMRANITLIGFDNLQTPLSGTMQKAFEPGVLSRADVVVLPVIGTDDKGEISSIFTSKTLILTEEHMKALPNHATIFTGLARPYLKKLCNKYHISYVELMQRDDVAIYNSIPTVEGAIMMAIQNTDITIHSSNTLVLGLGRVGLTLARTLQAIGAHVKTGISNSADFARAFEMGVNPFYLHDLEEHAENAELIFNTIPAQVLTATVLARVRHDAVMIDIASKPGGIDYHYAEKRGLKAILCPSLPGIVAPKTAGRIIAATIRQLMMEEIAKEVGQ